MDQNRVRCETYYNHKFSKMNELFSHHEKTFFSTDEQNCDDWESLWDKCQTTPAALQQAKKEWGSLTKEDKTKMEHLIRLAIDMFMEGLNEEVQTQKKEKNKIFVKLLIQEWNSTKETMSLVGDLLNEE